MKFLPLFCCTFFPKERRNGGRMRFCGVKSYLHFGLVDVCSLRDDRKNWWLSKNFPMLFILRPILNVSFAEDLCCSIGNITTLPPFLRQAFVSCGDQNYLYPSVLTQFCAYVLPCNDLGRVYAGQIAYEEQQQHSLDATTFFSCCNRWIRFLRQLRKAHSLSNTHTRTNTHCVSLSHLLPLVDRKIGNDYHNVSLVMICLSWFCLCLSSEMT